MAIVVTTPIVQEPVSLQELKQHLRLDPTYTDEDSYLVGLISTAREVAEQETRRSLAPQGIQALIEVPLLPAGMITGPIGWRPSQIDVPMPPVTTISLLEGEYSPGLFKTIDPANYVVDLVPAPAYIYLLSSAYSFLSSQWSLWIGPYSPRFRITYTAGYSAPGGVPLPFMLKRAVLELAGFLYSYREGRDEGVGGRYASRSSFPQGILDKFDKYRVFYG